MAYQILLEYVNKNFGNNYNDIISLIINIEFTADDIEYIEKINMPEFDKEYEKSVEYIKRVTYKKDYEIMMTKSLPLHNSIHYEDNGYYYSIPQYGDIINCVLIPKHIKWAKLSINGYIYSTWNNNIKCKQIFHEGKYYYKVNFFSPMFLTIYAPYGCRFIILPEKQDWLLIQQIILNPRDWCDAYSKTRLLIGCYNNKIYTACDGCVIEYNKNNKHLLYEDGFRLH